MRTQDMMKLRFSFLALLLIGTVANVSAQLGAPNHSAAMLRDYVDPYALNNSIRTGENYKDIGGTAYFEEDWLTADMVNSTGQEFKQIFVKIDLFQQAILVKTKEEELVLKTALIKELALRNHTDGSTTRFVSMQDPEKSKKALYQELYSGKMGLYKLHKKKVEQSLGSTNSYANTGKMKFQDEVAYYIKNKKGNLLKLDGGKSAIFDLFPEHKGKIKSFLKDEKIKVRQEEDLIKLVKYLETL